MTGGQFPVTLPAAGDTARDAQEGAAAAGTATLALVLGAAGLLAGLVALGLGAGGASPNLMPIARAWRLSAAIALLALLVAPALPGAAGGRVLAHAQLVASSPGSGATVPEVPDEIAPRLQRAARGRRELSRHRRLERRRVLTRAGEIDPDDPYALVVTGAPLVDGGIYLVTWRTVSAADGHPAQGFFYFGVGDVAGSLARWTGRHGSLRYRSGARGRPLADLPRAAVGAGDGRLPSAS